MILAIDVGNSNVTCCVFNCDEIIKKFNIESKGFSDEYYVKELERNFAEYTIDGCIISSVVPELNATLENAVKNLFNIQPNFVTNEIHLNIGLKVSRPETVGADRIVNASYAAALCKTPVIVVDMGTATTFDVVDKEGDFIGGAIMPGVTIQLKSLCEKTSLLPNVVTKDFKGYMGFDTESAILAGVVGGMAAAVDGLLARSEEELGEKVYVILTGGIAPFVYKHMNRKCDKLDVNHTLKGLNYLYNLNFVK